MQAISRCCVLFIVRGLRNRTRVFQNTQQFKYSTQENPSTIPTIPDMIDAKNKAEQSMARLQSILCPPELKELHTQMKALVENRIKDDQVLWPKQYVFNLIFPDMIKATDELRKSIEKDQYNAGEDFRIIKVADDENQNFVLQFICAEYEAELSKNRLNSMEMKSLRRRACRDMLFPRSITSEERAWLKDHIEDPVLAKTVQIPKKRILSEILKFEHYHELYKIQFPTALEKFVAEAKAKFK